MDFVFPFGRPVSPCKPSADGPRRFFILGAYPSALHVRWTLPTSGKGIRAVAVDNEPEPFWCGGDSETGLLDEWKLAVGWNADWGDAVPAGSLNGSSGAWVEAKVLKPLSGRRNTAWITDCLDTYRCSGGLADRIKDTYNPFARRMGLKPAVLRGHPSEDEIVNEALNEHRKRLCAELSTAKPEIVVTLGNAALRVLKALVEPAGGAKSPGSALSANVGEYGRKFKVRIGSRTAEWLPLAHPAAPKAYQTAHGTWMEGA